MRAAVAANAAAYAAANATAYAAWAVFESGEKTLKQAHADLADLVRETLPFEIWNIEK